MSTVYNWGIWIVLILPIAGILCSYFSIKERRAAGTMVFFLGLTALGADLLFGYRLLHHLIPTFLGSFSFWSFALPDGGFQGVFPANSVVDIGLQVSLLSLGMLALFSTSVWLGAWQAVRTLKSTDGLQRMFVFVTLVVWGACGVMMSGNLFLATLMWGITGLGMWLMVGHLWQRQETRTAATIVALTNRLSDGFLFAALVVWFIRLATFIGLFANVSHNPGLDTFSFTGLNSMWTDIAKGASATAGIGDKTLWFIAGAVTLAVLLRMASLPWLFRIQAITEVTPPVLGVVLSATIAPGVMLLVRLYPLLHATPHFLPFVLAVVVISALVAAVESWLSDDIVVSYSYAVAAVALLAVAALAAGSTVAAIVIAATVIAAVVPLAAAMTQAILRYESSNVNDMADIASRYPLVAGTLLAVALLLIGGGGWPIALLSTLTHTTISNIPSIIPMWERIIGIVCIIGTVSIGGARILTLSCRMSFGPIRKRRGFEPTKMRKFETRDRRLFLLGSVPLMVMLVMGYPWAALAVSHVIRFQVGSILPPATAGPIVLWLLALLGVALLTYVWMTNEWRRDRATPSALQALQTKYGHALFEGGWGFHYLWDKVTEQYPVRAGRFVDETDRLVFAPLYEELAQNALMLMHAVDIKRRKLEQSALTVPLVGLGIVFVLGLLIYYVNVGQW